MKIKRSKRKVSSLNFRKFLDILSPKKIRKLKEDISLKAYKNKILNIMYKINESRLVKKSVMVGNKSNVRLYVKDSKYNLRGIDNVEISINDGNSIEFECSESEQANLAFLDILGLKDKFGEQVMNAVTTAIENCIKDTAKSVDVKKAISIMVDNVVKVEKDEKMTKEDTIKYLREDLPKRTFSVYTKEFEDELRRRGYGDVIGDKLL